MNVNTLSDHFTNLVNTACPALFRCNYLNPQKILCFSKNSLNAENIRVKGLNKR